MKTRHGFVSNSSSSSFLIITKKGTTKSKFLKELKIDKDSYFYGFAKDFTDYIFKYKPGTIEEFLKDIGSATTLEEALENEDLNQETFDALRSVEENNLEFREVYGSNEDDNYISQYLYYNELEIDSENLKVLKRF